MKVLNAYHMFAYLCRGLEHGQAAIFLVQVRICDT